MSNRAHSTKRDRSRTVDAKLATISRNVQRRRKSAALFMAWAFPADGFALSSGRV